MDIHFNIGMYTILMVGCGGTGSQLLSPLFQLCNNVRDKINKIIIVDGDRYEDKNIQNQRCMSDDIGENKAFAMARRYGYVFQDLTVESYEDYITTQKQLKILVSHYSNVILIGCVDNNATRKLLNDFFNNSDSFKNIIYIDSGNGTNTRSGQVGIGYKHFDNVLLNPVGNIFEHILNTDEKIEHVGTCMRLSNDHPQNIATNMYAASIVFNIVTNILMFNKIENHLVFFDANNSTVYTRK